MKLKRDSAKPSTEVEEFDGQRWEYRARNLTKVAGMNLERDFNEHGAAGWEFVAVADGYAVFKRPVAELGASELELQRHLTA